MAHNTNFRPFHTYRSYYPYYLPSYYSRFYPNHYDRYFEPTTYWLEKRQAIIEERKKNVIPINKGSPEEIKSNETLIKWFIGVLVIVLICLLLKKN